MVQAMRAAAESKLGAAGMSPTRMVGGWGSGPVPSRAGACGVTTAMGGVGGSTTMATSSLLIGGGGVSPGVGLLGVGGGAARDRTRVATVAAPRRAGAKKLIKAIKILRQLPLFQNSQATQNTTYF